MPPSNEGAVCVAPTEDAIMALLEFFVEPLLPSRSASAAGKHLTLTQEASMAKQVQAVVLLYNHYHRRDNPELEYLDFISFCKLAVIFKPSLLNYMKVMQRADHNDLVDLEKEFSLTERMAMEACNISKGLDASEDVVARWPISKVVIFLVDYRQENVFLLQSSDTLGVWSAIEKDTSLGTLEGGSTNHNRGTKKKRITKKPLKENRSFDENGLQQLAFAAVKDACGCSQSDLKVLESHTVHSLSKEKTSARFYVMQCTLSKDEHNYVPVRDVIKSLQGPLVRKGAQSWSTTSVVEYFLLLPYAQHISNWFSRKEPFIASNEVGLKEQNQGAEPTDALREDHGREKSQNEILTFSGSEQRSKMLHVEEHCYRGTTSNVPEQTDAAEAMNICETVTSISKTEHKGQAVVSEKQNKEAVQSTLQAKCEEISVSCSLNDMDVYEPVPAAAYAESAKAKNCSGEGHIAYEMSRLRSPATDGVEKFVEGVQSINEHDGAHAPIEEDKPVSSSHHRVQDHALVPFGSGPKGFDKIHEVISAKGSLLVETALKALHRKREMLRLQLHNIQDEITLCDRNIQTILMGGEDDLAVTLDAIIEGCNDKNTMSQQVRDESSSGCLRRKRSYESA